jgi:NAD(P)-dependent dehydrogenase (short-subunit alcohol dehydrogenase family)
MLHLLPTSSKTSRDEQLGSKRKGIRFNAIGAGIIDTPMHKKEAHETLKDLHPIRRLGTVQEIVDALLFLENATFVTGEIVHIDGGKW